LTNKAVYYWYIIIRRIWGRSSWLCHWVE